MCYTPPPYGGGFFLLWEVGVYFPFTFVGLFIIVAILK